ncbi:MAG TPA: hypothetical protein PLL30_15600 [Candidatus Krumholzibacteria bacterium]|nr:hypothetical protein [Candidatus Krumholzibacteria bacterium]HPD73196.1 hypothetical protein [Candidatus Krumholzibacteria bacterium]HRY41926.1 hypothetical protein [Candidatus Krumholzibacteria bacterium]
MFARTWMVAGAMVLVLSAGLWVVAGCSDEDDEKIELSSRSYQGHASDADVNNFVRVYQHAVGTRLDDCQTCHTGATVLDDDAEEFRANPCDFCHFIEHPQQDWTGLPTEYSETLNPYGAAYLAAGRDADAVRAIADEDSDGDDFTNEEEIEDLRYPGDPTSNPGQELCPVLTVSLAEIQALPPHTQFTLANANKQQFDFYATYTGVKIGDLLAALDVDLTGATSVDLLAPDGFAKSFDIEEITGQFPSHRFFANLGVDDLGQDCAFVDYPENTYEYADNDVIEDEQWHLLAYAREGQALDPCYPEPASGRIAGEGPFRNVVPPGSDDDALNQPDRGSNEIPGSCPLPEWDYDFAKDHNAGAMVKGVVIIRINPMPGDCEEFDIINGGWAMIDAGEILVYGHGVQTR